MYFAPSIVQIRQLTRVSGTYDLCGVKDGVIALAANSKAQLRTYCDMSAPSATDRPVLDS